MPVFREYPFEADVCHKLLIQKDFGKKVRIRRFYMAITGYGFYTPAREPVKESDFCLYQTF